MVFRGDSESIQPLFQSQGRTFPRSKKGVELLIYFLLSVCMRHILESSFRVIVVPCRLNLGAFWSIFFLGTSCSFVQSYRTRGVREPDA